MDQSLEPVSAEHNGIILSGVGVTEDALRETMEARESSTTETHENTGVSAETAPETGHPVDVPETAEQAAQRARDEQGRFAKPTRGQKRFDQLTKERETERQAREAAEQRAAEYEARIKALEERLSQPAPAAQPTTPDPTPQAAPRSGAPKLAEFVAQIGTTYQDYESAVEAYTEARIAHQSTDFDARIRDRIEAERASRAMQSHLEGIFEAGRKAYPDFDAVRTRSTVQFPDLRPILTAPNAPDLIYALSKDDALAQRIAAITDPVQLGWALAQVVTPKAGASTASPASVVSNAPVPYQPVGSGSKTTAPTLDELAASGGDDYDSSGYRERRRAERQQSRR